ncbi:MAG: hypothetical protein SFW67_06495 [Myxococcaceae bacterium]|nr:hypothetical protein [Myxococcaceae bacterium]
MVLTVLVLSLAAAAPLESRLFIASGATSKAEAQKQLAALRLPPELHLSKGYPKLVESKAIAGLNPGFFLVALGTCDDVTAAQSSHGNGLAAVIQRKVKGAYAKPVVRQPSACPLWLDAGDVALENRAALLENRDDIALLTAAASALHQETELIGAAMRLRRALALGASGSTVELARTVEFLLEDAPDRLPR